MAGPRPMGLDSASLIRRRSVVGSLVAVAIGCVALIPADVDSATPKCKRTEATIIVGGEKRCVPVSRAFPKPSFGDERIAEWKTALDPASGFRDRRGRSLASLKRTLGAGGRRIHRALVATMPKALARLDALAARRGAASRNAPASVSAPRCGQAGQRQTSGLSNNVNGIQVGGSVNTSGRSQTMNMTARTGDLFVRTSTESDTCSKLVIPPCPTAAGVLRNEGVWVKRERVSIVAFRDAELVYSTFIESRRTTTVRGQTAADAKLDYIDIDDQIAVSFGGSGASGSNPTRNFTLKRRVRVNMRARPESYAPGNAAFESFSGASPGMANYDDRGFAAMVGTLIAEYRFRETGGGFADSPGKCAELKFNPPSDTLPPLRKDAFGQVNVRVESNGAGGNPRATAAKSVITRTGQENATLNPANATGSVIPFGYVVTNAGQSLKAKATFKATSTAGLAAEATWTQPTRPSEPPVKRITGTYTGFSDFVGQRFDWTGTITYVRDQPNDPGAAGSYVVSSGNATFTASGKSASGHACNMSGSQQFAIPAGSGFAGVLGTLPDQEAPYTYNLSSALEPMASMNVTLSGCVAPDEEFEGTIASVIVSGFMPLQTGGLPFTSSDGLLYQDSMTQNQPPFLSAGYTWSLVGELTP